MRCHPRSCRMTHRVSAGVCSCTGAYRYIDTADRPNVCAAARPPICRDDRSRRFAVCTAAGPRPRAGDMFRRCICIHCLVTAYAHVHSVCEAGAQTLFRSAPVVGRCDMSQRRPWLCRCGVRRVVRVRRRETAALPGSALPWPATTSTAQSLHRIERRRAGAAVVCMPSAISGPMWRSELAGVCIQASKGGGGRQLVMAMTTPCTAAYRARHTVAVLWPCSWRHACALADV